MVILTQSLARSVSHVEHADRVLYRVIVAINQRKQNAVRTVKELAHLYREHMGLGGQGAAPGEF